MILSLLDGTDLPFCSQGGHCIVQGCLLYKHIWRDHPEKYRNVRYLSLKNCLQDPFFLSMGWTYFSFKKWRRAEMRCFFQDGVILQFLSSMISLTLSWLTQAGRSHVSCLKAALRRDQHGKDQKPHQWAWKWSPHPPLEPSDEKVILMTASWDLVMKISI